MSAADGTPAPIIEEGRARRHLAPLLVLVLGLLVTGVLTWTCWVVNDHNETRLLRLQVREIGTVLSASIPNVEDPLDSAADIAYATNGDPARFAAYVAPYAEPPGPFVSMSLWQLAGATPRMITAVGSWRPPGASSPVLMAALQRTSATHELHVSGSFGRRHPYIAYALAASSKLHLVVFAESAVHPDQPLNVARNSAFADLNYALYLGPWAGQRTCWEQRTSHSCLLAARRRRSGHPSATARSSW